eukprot:m.34671 g.34671  ORF g.34671 m.34671 type:complete len:901 (+) comp11049_c0_seq3:276-2978(+)
MAGLSPSGRTVAVQVEVVRIFNMQITKDEGAWMNFHIDFAGQTGQPSENYFPSAGADQNANYKFTFDISAETPEDVERVANSKISLRANEVMREKKKKTETVTPLGHISIDVLPLLIGETKIDTTLAAQSESGITPVKDTPALSFHVVVSTPQPLLTPEQLADYNIITCTLEGISRIPATMINSGSPSIYSLQLGGPDAPISIEFSEGHGIQTENEPLTYEVDNTDLESPMTTDNTMVVFHERQHRRCISSEQQRILVEYISRTRVGTATLTRATPSPSAKGKSRVDDDLNAQRCVADMKFTHLLYPGVCRTTLGCIFRAFKPTPVEAEPQFSQEDPKRKIKKGTTPQPDQQQIEGQAFEDSGTFAVVTFEFARPLVKQRSRESICRRVSDLVPPREVEPAPLLTAQAALDGFKSRILTIGSDLIKEYRTIQQSSQCEAAEAKQQVLYKLNTSGRYEAFKEQLKTAVVSLVREKFAEVTSLQDEQSKQAFISKLYVYLTHQMHHALNEEFSFNRTSALGTIEVPKDHLHQFAAECEGLLQFDKAESVWAESVQRFENDAETWFEYGTFCARVGDYSKAEECLRNAVSLTQTFPSALAVLGMIAVLDGRSQEGLDLLEAATTHDPNSCVFWACRYLATLHVDPDSVSAQMLLDRATKQYQQEGKSVEATNNYSSCLLKTADALINYGITSLAESAVATQLLLSGPSVGVRLIQARLDIANDHSDHSEAHELLDQCLSESFNDSDIWALLGHAHFATNPDKAREYYEHALQLPTTTTDEDIIQLRLGKIYLGEDEHSLAKNIYLRTCNQRPSSMAWLGLGIACYRLGELSDAEEALAEANIYDPRNPTIWAYLCLICLRTGRGVEAEQCYKYAMKLGCHDEAIKEEIQLEMTELGVQPSLIL